MSSVQNKSQSTLSTTFLNPGLRPSSRDQTNAAASSTMSSKLGGVQSWGPSIWKTNSSFGNSLSSTSATREGMAVRDTTLMPFPNDTVEGKTGSGALVDSSVSDDSWYARPTSFSNNNNNNNNNTSNNKSAERAAVEFKASDSTFGQQRDAGSAAISHTYGGAARQSSTSTFSSRHPPVSLNNVSATKAPFVGSFEALPSSVSNINEAPQVYTKYNHQSSRPTDSAWGDGPTTHSPVDERKSSVTAYFGIQSQPASRNNSLPPSRHSDVPPQYPVRDFYPAETQAVLNRTNSMSGSSRQSGGTTLRFDSPMDQMSTHFGQMSTSGHSQGFASQHRPSVSGYYGQTSAYSSTSPTTARSTAAGAVSHAYEADDVEEISRTTYGDAFSAQAGPESMNYQVSQYDNRPCTSAGLQQYPRQAAHYPGSAASQRSLDHYSGSHMASGHAAVLDQKLRSLPQYQDQRFSQEQRQMSMTRPSTSNMGAYGHYAFQQGGFAPGVPVYSMHVPTGFAHGLPMGMMPVVDMSMIPRAPREHPEASHGMRSQILEDFKQNAKTNKRCDWKDVYGHVVEFSGDQHGSRFIQLKLESANSDEKERIFRELQPNALQLMTDVFGNYVIQKFFEHGDQTQKKILASKMKGQVRQLSLQMYGCRVVQKALDHILNDQQASLIHELKDDVIRCVKDQNGNHVIQKAIERCDPKDIEFIFAAFSNQIHTLSIHTYGCRVIQRCLEHCELATRQNILRELQESMPGLIGDAFGNYVVQHVVVHGEAHDKQKVFDLVIRGLEGYSKHKFASNVVEQCLTHASDAWRREVVNIIIQGNRREGEGMLIGCIRDNYGNYVIQKLLDVLNQSDYYYFMPTLNSEMSKAKRTGCGKQVMAIDKKMHRFGGQFNPLPQTVAAVPYTSHNSAATTPPPLTSDTRSVQTSSVASINGDAIEGAHVAPMGPNGRKGSMHSGEPAVFEYGH